ncbi:MAG: class I SAM-dependent methyltransferase [Bacteroidales bacterium]|nr:class I SAM-dependent methyltransferase [Bacteroidales bacterium]
MSEPSCPFCKSKQIEYSYSTRDINENTWNLYFCNHCLYYFLNPFPSIEQLQQAYQTDYYGAGKKKFSFPLIENVIDLFRRKRANILFRLLKKNIEANILDIGCGNGRFLNYLYQKGCTNLYGIELPGKSAERAATIPHIRLTIGDIYSSNFQKNTVDAVTMFHVFEHLPQPDVAIEQINNWLKEEGILMVSFPNIQSRQARWFKGNWLHLDPPRHINFITPKNLTNKLQQWGYTLIDEKYFSLEQNPFGYVQSILNKWCKKRELLFEFLKGNKNYAKDSRFVVVVHLAFFVVSLPLFILLDAIDSLFKQSGTVMLIFKKTK